MRFSGVFKMKVSLSALLLAFAGLAAAGTSELTVNSTGPLLGESGDWESSTGTASSAEISYEGEVDDPGAVTAGKVTEFKFNTSGSDIEGRTLDGNFLGVEGPDGTFANTGTSGFSTVSSPTGASYDYYSVTWNSFSSVEGPGTTSFGGTYDPFVTTFGDLNSLGYTTGSQFDIFNIAGLYAGSGLTLGPKEAGSFRFQSYMMFGTQRVDFIDIVASGLGETVNITGLIGSNPNVEIYLLDANDPTEFSPEVYADAGTLLTSELLTRLLQDSFVDGVLQDDFNFGIFYRDFTVPEQGGRPDGAAAFSHHVDTVVRVQTIPGPGAVAVFLPSLVALARRRKRSQ